MISPIYAGILGLMMIALTIRVIRLRWVTRTGIGEGNDPALGRAIRAHGNFVETVPVALILMVLMETMGAGAVWLHIYGIALVLGRGLHAFGLSRSAGTSAGRLTGMILTLLVLAVGSVACLWMALT